MSASLGSPGCRGKGRIGVLGHLHLDGRSSATVLSEAPQYFLFPFLTNRVFLLLGAGIHLALGHEPIVTSLFLIFSNFPCRQHARVTPNCQLDTEELWNLVLGNLSLSR